MIRNLKIDEVQTPAWWSAAVYELSPSGNWRFRGYTEPRWETWGEYMQKAPLGANVRTYNFRNTGSGPWEQIY